MLGAGACSADSTGRQGGAGQCGGRARQPPEGGRRRLDPASAGALGPPRAPHYAPITIAPSPACPALHTGGPSKR